MAYTPADYFKKKAEDEAIRAETRAKREAERQANINKAIQQQTANKNTQAVAQLTALKNKTSSSSSSSSNAPTQSTAQTQTPIFTGQDESKKQSIAIPEQYTVKTFKNSSGMVTGVQDPISQKSYAINPTSQSNIKTLEQARAEQIFKTSTPTPQKSLYTNGTGAINQASPQQIEARKRDSNIFTSSINKFVSGFQGTGVTGSVKPLYSGGNRWGENLSLKERFEGGAEATGQLAGYAFDLAGISNAGKFASAGKKVLTSKPLTTAVKLTQQASKNPLGFLATNAVLGTTAFEGTKAVGGAYQNVRYGKGLNQQEKKVFGNSVNKEIFTKAREEELNAKNGFLQDVGETFLPNQFGNSEVFGRSVSRQLTERGYNPRMNLDTTTVLLKEREARGNLVLPSYLATGAVSQFTGINAVNTALGSGAKPVFSTYFNQIGRAGFGEGFSGVLINNYNVGDTRTNPITDFKERSIGFPVSQAVKEKYPNLEHGLKFKTNIATESLIGGATGYLTSGGLGGLIGVTAQPSKKILDKGLGASSKRVSKGLEFAGYVLDPTEYPSDLVEQFTLGVSRSATKNPKFPVFADTSSFIFSNTNTQTQQPAQNFKPKTKNFVFSNIPNDIFNFESKPKSNIPVNPFSDTPISQPVNPFIDQPVNQPVEPFADIPINEQVEPFVDIPVNPLVNTDVFSTIPVNTPIFKIPPPMPLSLPFGAGAGWGYGGKVRTNYLDELDASTNIFYNNLSGRLYPKQQKEVNKKRRQQEKIFKKQQKQARKSTSQKRQSNTNHSSSAFFKKVFG